MDLHWGRSADTRREKVDSNQRNIYSLTLDCDIMSFLRWDEDEYHVEDDDDNDDDDGEYANDGEGFDDDLGNVVDVAKSWYRLKNTLDWLRLFVELIIPVCCESETETRLIVSFIIERAPKEESPVVRSDELIKVSRSIAKDGFSFPRRIFEHTRRSAPKFSSIS